MPFKVVFLKDYEETKNGAVGLLNPRTFITLRRKGVVKRVPLDYKPERKIKGKK